MEELPAQYPSASRPSSLVRQLDVLARTSSGDSCHLILVGAASLVLACIFFLPDALQVVTAQALRARGDVVAPTLTHLASYVMVMLPLGYFLAIPAHWGISGIVWSVIIASYISAGLLQGRFWILARRD